MVGTRTVLLLVCLVAVLLPAIVKGDDAQDIQSLRTELEVSRNEIQELKTHVSSMDARVVDSSICGGWEFLVGAFCALWAQNTRRNAWLWFFLGAIFSVITLVVLLVKNGRDLRRAAYMPSLF